MTGHSGSAILCGILVLLLAVPVPGAVTPLWIEPATVGGELSGVVISADGETIIAGGDQLISLSHEGQKRWTGWSGTCLAVSDTGDYILSSQGQVLRLISARGTLIWDRSMDIAVTDLALSRDASLIAATGGGRVRILSGAGEGISSNSSLAVNHIRIMPSGDRILLTTNKNIQISNLTLLPLWSDTNSSQNLVEIAGDGSSFVTATDSRYRMYSGTGNLLWEKKFPGGNAQALAYSRDGSTIVIGMDDGSVHVLNRQGMELFSAAAENWITSVAVSGDGNTIAFGSMDKRVYVYNHAGAKLGFFTTKSPIQDNSVAVTADGSLIVVVDDTAVYGLSRASFMTARTGEETIAETPTEPMTEVPTTTASRTPTLTITTRPPIPTPYPTTTETPEAALPPAAVLVAVGLLLLYRTRK